MSLRRNSAWMLGSRALRALVAAVYFTLLARALGVSGYGAFAGVCAMAGIVSPFASMGTGNILIQEVARDRTAFALRWGNCLLITSGTGALFAVLLLFAGRLLLPHSVSWFMILNISVSDLLFVRLLDVSAMAFQALEQLRMTAWFSLALTISRLSAAALLCLTLPRATASQWSALYLVSTAVPACLAVVAVARSIGFPLLRLTTNPREILHGAFFSVSHSAQTVYNDIDKTMLVRISGLSAAGLYGAAYRMVDAAFTPVAAVQAAAYARFFQRGAHGLHEGARLAARILARAASYSTAAGVVLWIVAPAVPAVLGREFADTTTALRLLSPLLLLRSLHSFAADSLTGAGYQGTRTLLQVAVAMLNVGLNLILLPRWSWRGAAWLSLVCEATLALALWLMVCLYCIRERTATASELAPEALRA